MPRLARSLLALLLAPAAGLRFAEWKGQNRKLPTIRIQRPEENYEVLGDGPQGMKLDWVISKAVAKWYPFKVDPSHEAVDADDAVALGRAALDKQRELGDRIWVFGSHGRAGTPLLYKLAENQAQGGAMMCASFGKYGFVYRWCKKHDPRIWFLSDLTGEHVRNVSEHGRSFRAVNLIRDPIAMVISGYMLHLHANDTPAVLLPIRNATLSDGLAMEADFQFNHSLPEMIDAYQNAPRPQTLHVRYESLALDPVDFDAAVERVYNHTLGDLMEDRVVITELLRYARLMDFTRNAKPGMMPQEIADQQVAKLVEALPKATLERLKRARAALGYA